MNININGVEYTPAQIEEIVAKHLAKKEEPTYLPPTYLPEGTICWVRDYHFENARIRVADGTGKVYVDGCNTGSTINFKYYEPLEMGLIFSDEVITSEDIVLDMHKKLALCWDDNDIATKVLRVIDANNKSTFRYDGSNDSWSFRNYRLCTTPYPNLPQWARDMIDACKD